MEYKIFDQDGDQDSKGEIPDDYASDCEWVEVPTHGAISFLLPSGLWLNIATSEWVGIHTSELPEGHP